MAVPKDAKEEEEEARQTLLQVEVRFTEALGTSQQCCRCVKLTVRSTQAAWMTAPASAQSSDWRQHHSEV
jgi:hypothetical protein